MTSIWEPSENFVYPSGNITTETLIAEDSQVVFTLTSFQYIPGTGTIDVFVNGVRVDAVVELSPTTFQLPEDPAIVAGSEVVVRAQKFQPSDLQGYYPYFIQEFPACSGSLLADYRAGAYIILDMAGDTVLDFVPMPDDEHSVHLVVQLTGGTKGHSFDLGSSYSWLFSTEGAIAEDTTTVIHVVLMSGARQSYAYVSSGGDSELLAGLDTWDSAAFINALP